MATIQFFPILPELFAHACATVSERVSQLPFLRGGVRVTGELIGIAMESLNAVPAKALSITTRGDNCIDPGLDACIGERIALPGTAAAAAPVIAEVLCSAGIAEPALIPDRAARRQIRGVRLLPQWTWHIASTLAPSVRLGGDPLLAWLDLCPVCRTGIMDKVTGKQLFGIPRVDFYIECGSCGAKFIPVGPAFRLVSISRIRDPLWKKHLDCTYPPDTWAEIARGPGQAAAKAPALPASPSPVKKAPPPVLPHPAVTLTPAKDGSLALPLLGKILYFRPVALRFAGGLREDTFARVQTSLEELLREPAYEHLRSPVNARYSRYLPLKAGLFLSQLRERHDPFYREFLHRYGDEKFGMFRAEESKDTERKGVLIVVVNSGLYLAADSPGPLGSAINHYGRIGPEDCLLSGDPVRCRINALLSAFRKEAGVFVHVVENAEERHAITDAAGQLSSAGPGGTSL